MKRRSERWPVRFWLPWLGWAGLRRAAAQPTYRQRHRTHTSFQPRCVLFLSLSVTYRLPSILDSQPRLERRRASARRQAPLSSSQSAQHAARGRPRQRVALFTSLTSSRPNSTCPFIHPCCDGDRVSMRVPTLASLFSHFYPANRPCQLPLAITSKCRRL